jgi:hypothetical protein
MRSSVYFSLDIMNFTGNWHYTQVIVCNNPSFFDAKRRDYLAMQNLFLFKIPLISRSLQPRLPEQKCAGAAPAGWTVQQDLQP